MNKRAIFAGVVVGLICILGSFILGGCSNPNQDIRIVQGYSYVQVYCYHDYYPTSVSQIETANGYKVVIEVQK